MRDKELTVVSAAAAAQMPGGTAAASTPDRPTLATAAAGERSLPSARYGEEFHGTALEPVGEGVSGTGSAHGVKAVGHRPRATAVGRPHPKAADVDSRDFSKREDRCVAAWSAHEAERGDAITAAHVRVRPGSAFLADVNARGRLDRRRRGVTVSLTAAAFDR
ncbi:hypothetical protein GCM10027447_21500 [Glycomyces halotolerans]